MTAAEAIKAAITQATVDDLEIISDWYKLHAKQVWGQPSEHRILRERPRYAICRCGAVLTVREDE